MNCLEKVDLSAFHDGEATLSPEQQNHLSSCPRCRRYMDTLRQQRNFLARCPDCSPRPSLNRDVYKEIRRVRMRNLFFKPQVKTLIGPAGLAFLALGVFSLSVLGLFPRKSGSEGNNYASGSGHIPFTTPPLIVGETVSSSPLLNPFIPGFDDREILSLPADTVTPYRNFTIITDETTHSVR